jgi:Flp pilus assembly pilin Flp
MWKPRNTNSGLGIGSGALVWRFLRDDEGQDLIEYAYLAAFIGTAGWFALNSIVPTVGTMYNSWLDPASGTPSLWEPAAPWSSSGS